jgi:ppGpp synthetase/RelA/SpoT-type nucleotidyltranferase
VNFQTYERSGRSAYAALAETVAGVLAAAMAQRDDLRLQQIQQRAKDPTSLKKKLEKLDALAAPEIEKVVKDLAGVRVVFYTNSDVSRFLASQIILENFDVDWDRTRIHHPPADPKEARDLFVSNNYVVKLKDERISLPEYAHFAGMWCEVQVQTTLNHAWSEMAHDTIYKKPKLAGFGNRLMKGIEARMWAIMRNYLAPAGYEFQKVLTDFERLASGKELFDQGALAAIESCADNNERYEVLSRFSAYVLPYYDDYGTVSADIVSSVARVVEQARATEVKPIDTPFGSLSGHTSHQIATLAAGIIEELRYANVELTLDVIADLYHGAEDTDEKQLWLRLAEALSRHELSVWEKVGPRVQMLLTERMRALTLERLVAIRPVALAVLREVLRPDVSGTSSTHNAITLHRGAVSPCEELRLARGGAIEALTSLFGVSGGDAERREIIQVLAAAWSMPGAGEPSPDLMVNILADARRIVDFYTGMVSNLSFELLQEIEHDLLWLYRHRQDSAVREGGSAGPVTEARRALLQAILAFRDRVNEDREFVIYKILVGFESVFPPAWDDPEFDYAAAENHRTREMEALVADISEQSAGPWLERIRRCAATESNDAATFPPFRRFLEMLGRAQPRLMLGYLEQMDERLARFLTPMVAGLVGTPEWTRAEAIITAWLRDRRYLSEIAWAVGAVSALGVSRLPDILASAMEAGDADAVLHVVAAASSRHDGPQMDALKATLLSGIKYLGARGDLRWVNALTSSPRPANNPLLLGLGEAETTALLDLLADYPRLEYEIEDLVAVFATTWPRAVVAFLGQRLRLENEEKRTNYEALPYRLHSLDAPLAENPQLLIAAAKGWFDEDRALFEYRGGRLVASTFPAFSDRLEALLLERVASGDRDEIAFVIGILRAYEGQTFLHRVCKEIVAAVPSDDELLDLVSIVLDSMGVTRGEFGRVAGFQRKKTEIEAWLEDSREQVRSFAERHLHQLDQQIAAEQRRSEENLALRKLEYEEPDP